MSPDPASINGDTSDEPVAVLRGLELEPTSDLRMGVRRRIERRFLGRDLLGFFFTAGAHLVMEWLSAFFGRLSVRRPPEGE